MMFLPGWTSQIFIFFSESFSITMESVRLTPISIVIVILILPFSLVQCRPHSQRILIHGHEWIVPNEPGWEDGKSIYLMNLRMILLSSILVVQKADSIRRQWLSNCMSTRDCLLAAERLSQFFSKHPISSAYYDDSIESNVHDNDESSIFKWG